MRGRIGLLTCLALVIACKPGSPTADDTGPGTEGAVDDSSETETDEVPPTCDPAPLAECEAVATEALLACFAGCSCDELDCAAGCHAAMDDDYWGCAEQVCPDTWWTVCDWHSCPPSEHCRGVCDARRSECIADEQCDLNMCEYQWLNCTDLCEFCNSAYFHYSYQGSCEVVLPGPATGYHEFYVTVDIGDLPVGISAKGLGCADPGAYDVVWLGDAHLLLCEAACDMFATAGSLVVTFGFPPCE